MSLDERSKGIRLSTLIVVSDANGALRAEAMGPVSTNLNIGLGHLGVSEQEPESEDGLRKDVEDGVGDDLSVDGGLAGTVGNTPDTFSS